MSHDIIEQPPSEKEKAKDGPTPLETQLGPTLGAGLSLEQLRSVISQVHGEMLPKDDATLIVATILNVYLAEIETLHGKHRQALGRIMAEKTDAYVSGVQEAVAQLAEKLSSASVEAMRTTFAEHTARLQLFQSSLIWLAAIVATSALLNVVMFVLRGLR